MLLSLMWILFGTYLPLLCTHTIVLFVAIYLYDIFFIYLSLAFITLLLKFSRIKTYSDWYFILVAKCQWAQYMRVRSTVDILVVCSSATTPYERHRIFTLVERNSDRFHFSAAIYCESIFAVSPAPVS